MGKNMGIKCYFLVGRPILPGVPEVAERVRAVQQGMDQGKDIHPAQKTSQHRQQRRLSLLCLENIKKKTSFTRST